MNNQLQTQKEFTNELFGKLTTITNENNEVYFIGKEVATLLGYSDTAYAISTHCKGVEEMSLPSKGGNQVMKIIPERDLYRLVIRSKKEEAEKFEEWVVGEILPSIRKTGSYQVSLPTTFIEALEQLLITEKEKERLTQENLLLEANNEDLRIELDKSHEWLTVKKVADLNKVSWKAISWKQLKAVSIGTCYKPKKVFDANFPDGVNAYHISAWRIVYPNFKY